MSSAATILTRLAGGSDAGEIGRTAEVRTTIAARGEGAIAFEAIGKTFPAALGPFSALADIDLTIAPGEIFGIIGRSGAGKSTLLRLINRLERPTTGRVLIDGQDIAALDEPGLVALRRRIGMVFQHFNILSAKTVLDNVALPLQVADVPSVEIRRRVSEALDLVGLADKHDVMPSRLSGGQKQRVGIARAVVNRPEILLCDEATSALDPETTLSILGLLKDINRRLGLTIVLITHEMSVIREICDRVLVLDRGLAVETGQVWHVFGQPRHAATRALLQPFERALPDDIADRIVPEVARGRSAEAVIALRFSGEREPDLSSLAARCGGRLRLLDAALDRIAGHTQGRLLVALATAPDGPLPDLSGIADGMEVLGYVALDD